MITRHPRVGGAALLLCVALAAGCGQPGSRVKGRVTHNGKPVVWGSVTLIASDNQPYSALLETDGSFALDGVPAGKAKVGVVSDNPDKTLTPPGGEDGRPVKQSPAPDRPKPAKGAWFPLPDKFGDPMTSGVSVTVTRGQSLEIDLK